MANAHSEGLATSDHDMSLSVVESCVRRTELWSENETLLRQDRDRNGNGWVDVPRLRHVLADILWRMEDLEARCFGHRDVLRLRAQWW